MWDGTVSGVEFHAESMAFLALWNSADATRYRWQWQPWPDSTAGGYLTLEDVPSPTAKCELELTLEGSDCSSDSADPSALERECAGDSADPAELVLDPASNNQNASFTDHVIYSESYKVPTLFFRGFHSDGGLLKTADVERILTPDSLLLLEKSPWTFLTQAEHPVLHRPWFSFHPCGTSKMMALILSDCLRTEDKLQGTQHSESPSSHDGTPLPGMPETSGPMTGNLLQLKPSSFRGQYLLAWLSIVGQVARLDLPLVLFKKYSSGTNYDGDYQRTS